MNYEVGEIQCEIRIQNDFDGNMIIFSPVSTPYQFLKVIALDEYTESSTWIFPSPHYVSTHIDNNSFYLYYVIYGQGWRYDSRGGGD